MSEEKAVTHQINIDVHSPVQSKRFSPALIIFACFWLLGIVLAAILFLSQPVVNSDTTARSTEHQATELIQLPAPDFDRSNLKGEQLELVDFRGRIVFLNFWATWCGPCRREMPAFQSFMQEQDEDGPIVLAVNDGESPDMISSFFDDIGVQDIPVLLDPDSSLRDVYGVLNLPTTFIIDEQGIIRSIKLGEMTVEDFESYISAISS